MADRFAEDVRVLSVFPKVVRVLSAFPKDVCVLSLIPAVSARAGDPMTSTPRDIGGGRALFCTGIAPGVGVAWELLGPGLVAEVAASGWGSLCTARTKAGKN